MKNLLTIIIAVCATVIMVIGCVTSEVQAEIVVLQLVKRESAYRLEGTNYKEVIRQTWSDNQGIVVYVYCNGNNPYSNDLLGTNRPFIK